MSENSVSVVSWARAVRLLARIALALRVGVLDPLEILRAHSINDYASFHFASVALAHGEDPYVATVLATRAAMQGQGANPYLYPPFLGYLLYPLSLLPVWPARLLWEAMSIAAAFGSLALLFRWVDERFVRVDEAENAKALAGVVVAILWPISASAWMGQVNIFIVLLLLAWWTRTGGALETSPWGRGSGVWLGIAIAIKMSPALLLAHLLIRRRWREAIVATATAGFLVAASCLAMGRHALAFPTEVLAGFLPGHRYHHISIPINLFGNDSLAALAIAMQGNRGGDLYHLSAPTAALQMILLALVLVIWARRSLAISADRAVSALMIVMILAPAYSWEHHGAFALFPLVVLAVSSAGGAARDASRRERWEAVLAFIFIAWICAPTNAFYMPPLGLGTTVEAFTRLPKIVPLLGVFVLLVGAKTRPAPLTAISSPRMRY